jgi:selenocysteine lyase/cysteine desulfurase
MFSRTTKKTIPQSSGRPAGFEYVADDSIYLDSACQSLRPQPVLDILTDYYTNYNACGGRVKYAWGRKVDEAVERTRLAVLELLKLPSKDYETSFTLNTTYGLNLLLHQLPQHTYTQIITSHIEHNSVFLSTIAAAKRLRIPRIVLDRRADGTLEYDLSQLHRAVVVVNAVSNIDGRVLQNLPQLISDVHAANGIVIIDAAQAMAHQYRSLQQTQADALCFSGHKMYGPSLGVVVARKELLASLDISLVGGGMVADVSESAYELLPDELSARLEPGLQAWAEIIALGRAIDWLGNVKPLNQQPSEYLQNLSQQLFHGLQAIDGLILLNQGATSVISLHTPHLDAHRLALYLSEAGIMVRSGYFCAHHYLKQKLALPPLLRFSIGLHSTEQDIATTLITIERIMKGLR